MRTSMNAFSTTCSFEVKGPNDNGVKTSLKRSNYKILGSEHGSSVCSSQCSKRWKQRNSSTRRSEFFPRLSSKQICLNTHMNPHEVNRKWFDGCVFSLFSDYLIHAFTNRFCSSDNVNLTGGPQYSQSEVNLKQFRNLLTRTPWQLLKH